MTTKQIKPFKRIHFFNGFVTKAEDWNAAEEYHNRKRELHNWLLHTPGVLQGYIDSLKVEVEGDGKHLQINAGCAIDPQGRELLVHETQTIEIDLEGFSAGQTLYVVLQYAETKRDNHQNLNSKYEDYKFIEESPEIEVTNSKEALENGIELARIHLGNSNRIREKDIDTSEVKSAGPRVTLQNSFECKVDEATQVHKEKGIEPVEIERVSLNQSKPVYFVNAHPKEGSGPVSWQIKAEKMGEDIVYTLHFTVDKKATTSVSYQVYKLKFSDE